VSVVFGGGVIVAWAGEEEERYLDFILLTLYGTHGLLHFE